MSKVPLKIDIVSDVVCPWCVIGFHRLKQALDRSGTDADIRWHSFELNPDMPEGGQNLREHLAVKYGTTREGSVAARKRQLVEPGHSQRTRVRIQQSVLGDWCSGTGTLRGTVDKNRTGRPRAEDGVK